MLKLIDRRWVSRAAQLRNHAFHQRPNFGTVVASRARIETNSKAPSLADVLARLEISLKYGNRANVDNIMENFRLIHSMNTIIPLAYFQDVANILSAQNDATRLELLIHLCKENMTVSRTKVRRPGDDPLDKLVSTAITGLFRYGNRDDASKLWVRMSNNGYVTSRVSMEQMIDRIAGSVDYAPPLQLLNAVHNASKAHLWHQNPVYFAKVLNLIRQNIIKDCKDITSLEKAEAVLERMWLDAQQALLYSSTVSGAFSQQQLPIELYALRLHCYSAASYVVAQNIGASSEQANSYNLKASSAFTELLERSKTAAVESSTAASAATFAEEIKRILSPYKVDKNSSTVNSAPGALSLPPLGNVVPFEGHNSLFTQLGDEPTLAGLEEKPVHLPGQGIVQGVAQHPGNLPRRSNRLAQTQRRQALSCPRRFIALRQRAGNVPRRHALEQCHGTHGHDRREADPAGAGPVQARDITVAARDANPLQRGTRPHIRRQTGGAIAHDVRLTVGISRRRAQMAGQGLRQGPPGDGDIHLVPCQHVQQRVLRLGLDQADGHVQPVREFAQQRVMHVLKRRVIDARIDRHRGTQGSGSLHALEPGRLRVALCQIRPVQEHQQQGGHQTGTPPLGESISQG